MHVHRAGKYSPKITMQYLLRLQRDTVCINITINILKVLTKYCEITKLSR